MGQVPYTVAPQLNRRERFGPCIFEYKKFVVASDPRVRLTWQNQYSLMLGRI